MATKKEKKQKPLEQVLMEACNKLRSNMSGINYMYFVMGLVFLKFAHLKFEKRRNELLNSEDSFAVDMPSFYTEKNVFYLPKNARWDLIANNAKNGKITLEVMENGQMVKKDFTIGMAVDNALEEIENNNTFLKGALPIGTYAKSTLPASNFASLIAEIDKIKEDEQHPMKDLIGKTYQYMLNAFAIKTADEKGEFYTPDNIVDLITTLIEPYEGKVYDPCCGSGGMFIQSYKFVEAHSGNVDSLSVYGQESNPDTWRLAKMNLAIRGIPANLGAKEADTFGSDQHKDEKFDFIIANPPFNLKNWRSETELVHDPRWDGFGVPPVSNANYAWILHMLSKLSINGVAGFLLANGALGDTDTKDIRKNLIKENKIEAIIVLPRQMFYYTDISVTLWIMRKHKNRVKVKQDGNNIQLRDRNNEILFMDLRTYGTKTPDGYFELSDKEKLLVKNIYNRWQSKDYSKGECDISELSKVASTEEIEKCEWSLIPSKYIKFVDHDLDIDFENEMKRIQSNFKKLLMEEKASYNDLINAFKGIGYDIE